MQSLKKSGNIFIVTKCNTSIPFFKRKSYDSNIPVIVFKKEIDKMQNQMKSVTLNVFFSTCKLITLHSNT